METRISWAIGRRDRNRARDRYAKHINGAKRLVRNAKYNYEASVVKCTKKQPKKYYAYIQSARSHTEKVGPLTTGRDSAAVCDIKKPRVISDYFTSAHRVDEGFDWELDLPLLPPDKDDLQIMEDTIILYLEDTKTLVNQPAQMRFTRLLSSL